MNIKPDSDKIKRWREERHWSQEHLADLAGIGTRTIQRIENGDPASKESVLALAAAFNVDVVALTVDAEQLAQANQFRDVEKKLAGLQLSLWIILASYAVVMLVFGAISISDNQPGFTMLEPAIWCTVGIAGYALTVLIVTLVVRFNGSGRDD